jgi:hypothetical protein
MYGAEEEYSLEVCETQQLGFASFVVTHINTILSLNKQRITSNHFFV